VTRRNGAVRHSGTIALHAHPALSDLHLEVHPQFVPEPAADADVLVLAGDIGSYQDGSLLQDDCFGLERVFAAAAVRRLAMPGGVRARQPRVRRPGLGCGARLACAASATGWG
jgi:hypothetical protein